MTAKLTEREFSQHVGTKFRVALDEKQIDLELVYVKGYPSTENERREMERFSAFFAGPANMFLQQHIYRLQHDRMGEFDIFLVPIGQNEEGFQYEAVFNYFKEG